MEGNGTERNLLLKLAFDGSDYHGWQVQKNARTVQEALQQALEKVFGARPDIKGCSRTDAGVHANDYACNFRTGSAISCRSVIRALNANLPDDIAVKSCREVAPAFHARYSCVGKEYIYKIVNRDVRDPFLNRYAFFYPYSLDLPLMNRAAKGFLGSHDYVSFRSVGAKDGNTVRCVTHAALTVEDGMVVYRVRADGFLYNMVRIMVGTLIAVARGQIDPDSIASIIEGRSRKLAGPTAPAHGLYLNHVFYEPGLFETE